MQLFRAGLTVRGKSQVARYDNPKNNETWLIGDELGSKYPAPHREMVDGLRLRATITTEVASSNSQDEIIFSSDCAFVRVTPISEDADGVFNGDIDFRLSSESIRDVFGNSLTRFVKKAWDKYNQLNLPDTEWMCVAYMTVFEHDENAETPEPIFRGYVPMDERLLEITHSDEFVLVP